MVIRDFNNQTLMGLILGMRWLIVWKSVAVMVRSVKIKDLDADFFVFGRFLDADYFVFERFLDTDCCEK